MNLASWIQWQSLTHAVHYRSLLFLQWLHDLTQSPNTHHASRLPSKTELLLRVTLALLVRRGHEVERKDSTEASNSWVLQDIPDLHGKNVRLALLWIIIWEYLRHLDLSNSCHNRRSTCHCWPSWLRLRLPFPLWLFAWPCNWKLPRGAIRRHRCHINSHYISWYHITWIHMIWCQWVFAFKLAMFAEWGTVLHFVCSCVCVCVCVVVLTQRVE